MSANLALCVDITVVSVMPGLVLRYYFSTKLKYYVSQPLYFVWSSYMLGACEIVSIALKMCQYYFKYVSLIPESVCVMIAF